MTHPSSRWDDLLGRPRPVFAGVCSRLAEETGLPIAVIRIAALLCCVLPTGFAYLLVAWLARGRDRAPAAAAVRPEVLRLRSRFGALEPRLASMEAMVTSREFDLRRGFRRMGE